MAADSADSRKIDHQAPVPHPLELVLLAPLALLLEVPHGMPVMPLDLSMKSFVRFCGEFLLTKLPFFLKRT